MSSNTREHTSFKSLAFGTCQSGQQRRRRDQIASAPLAVPPSFSGIFPRNCVEIREVLGDGDGYKALLNADRKSIDRDLGRLPLFRKDNIRHLANRLEVIDGISQAIPGQVNCVEIREVLGDGDGYKALLNADRKSIDRLTFSGWDWPLALVNPASNEGGATR
jgi:hypothetical protein